MDETTVKPICLKLSTKDPELNARNTPEMRIKAISRNSENLILKEKLVFRLGMAEPEELSFSR